jgi:hypothetical protein
MPCRRRDCGAFRFGRFQRDFPAFIIGGVYQQMTGTLSGSPLANTGCVGSAETANGTPHFDISFFLYW